MFPARPFFIEDSLKLKSVVYPSKGDIKINHVQNLKKQSGNISQGEGKYKFSIFGYICIPIFPREQSS